MTVVDGYKLEFCTRRANRGLGPEIKYRNLNARFNVTRAYT